MLDENNYPDEESLKQIKEWDILENGVLGLLDIVKENTKWADRQITHRGKRVVYYTYHTGGWSGNEDVIKALMRNFFFRSLYWEKTERGGHYYFRINSHLR